MRRGSPAARRSPATWTCGISRPRWSQLPDDQREALVLVGAAGFSYEEAAEISGCAVGTIKSRVNRARNRLADMLELDATEDGDAQSQDRLKPAASLRAKTR